MADRQARVGVEELQVRRVERELDGLAGRREVPRPADPVLGAATGNIGVIAGGCAANVIPEEATAQLMYRTVDNSGGLRAQVENVLRGRCEYEIVRETPALLMEKLDGFETDIVAFTTDLPHLTRWGRPLLLGPGSIRVAHTDHERVAKAELERAVELYCKLVHDLKDRAKGAERVSRGT